MHVVGVLYGLFIVPFFSRIIKEINLEYRLYPRWILQKKSNGRIPCIKDADCPFPSACCNDPFMPLEFCCYGWNGRKMQYAYAKQVIRGK